MVRASCGWCAQSAAGWGGGRTWSRAGASSGSLRLRADGSRRARSGLASRPMAESGERAVAARRARSSRGSTIRRRAGATSAGSNARAAAQRPVRLRGVSRDADAATGEVVREFATEREPDAVLLTPCGNRRAHVCRRVLGGLPRRRLAAGRLRAARRQGRARSRWPSTRWCSRPSPRRASGRCTRSARPAAGGWRAGRAAAARRARTAGRWRAPSATPTTTRASARRSARTASTTSAARCGTTTRAGCSSAPAPTSSASSPARPA